MNLEGWWEVASSVISYPSMYKYVTEGKFIFDEKLSKSSEFHYLEPSSNPLVKDFVKTLITFVQEWFNQSESFITVSVSQKTQKKLFKLQMKNLILPFYCTLGLGANSHRAHFQKYCWHWLSSDVEGKKTSQTRMCLDIVRILSLDIHRPGWVHY